MVGNPVRALLQSTRAIFKPQYFPKWAGHMLELNFHAPPPSHFTSQVLLHIYAS